MGKMVSKSFISIKCSGYLIPGCKQSSDLRREGTLAKLQCYSPTSIDHEIKPPVLLGHGVALVVEVRVGNADPDEAAARVGQNPASNYGSSAVSRERGEKVE